MLSKHILQEFLRQLDIEKRQLESAWFDSRLRYLEARFTLFSLHQLISTASRNIEKELIDFLIVRWRRVSRYRCAIFT